MDHDDATHAQSNGAPNAPLLLTDLTSPETGALGQQIGLILLPVGAHEQHGPALSVATDTMTAQVLCGLAGALLRPRVAVAPVIPWGVSWHHMAFPGTISLREETLIAVLEDIVGSLHRHGFDRFLIVNTHGGNSAAARIAADRLHRDHGVPVVGTVYAYALIADAARQVMDEAVIGHGGGDEAATLLAIKPELVRREKLTKGDLTGLHAEARQLLRAADGAISLAQDEITRNGITGDSTTATAEDGSAILAQAAVRLRMIAESMLPPENAVPDR